MKIKVPFTDSYRFNPEAFQEGTPVHFKYEENEHWFNGLISEVGPRMLNINNGFLATNFEVEDYTDGRLQITPLTDFKGEVVIDCKVFDSLSIPLGTLFIDGDGAAFIVTESDPFYLRVVDHKGEYSDVQAEILAGFSEEEIAEIQLVLPESFVIDQAEAYIAANKEEDVEKPMTMEEAEEYLRGPRRGNE